MKPKAVNADTCLHYKIQSMRGLVLSFDDIDRICLQCFKRLTTDEAEEVKKEIEHLRLIAKW